MERKAAQCEYAVRQQVYRRQAKIARRSHQFREDVLPIGRRANSKPLEMLCIQGSSTDDREELTEELNSHSPRSMTTQRRPKRCRRRGQRTAAVHFGDAYPQWYFERQGHWTGGHHCDRDEPLAAGEGPVLDDGLFSSTLRGERDAPSFWGESCRWCF